jgi:short-subunit dehydrogenase
MKAGNARVLLTGASGGIGQAMAQRLGRAGAQVMGVGRAPTPPAEAGTPAWVQADLTTTEGLATVTSAAASWRANVVVHAAGVPAFGPLGDVPATQVQAVLHANLLAPMLLTQALLPHLLRLPRAQIVFVGSALGRIGLPGFSVYGASKAGLHGFAEALRRELADSPVRVQTLGPRSTRTGFNGAAVEAYNRATGTAMDTPATVADALLQLIEGEAAERFIGFPERLAVRLNGVLSAVLDGAFSKHRRHLRPQPQPQPQQPEGTLT